MISDDFTYSTYQKILETALESKYEFLGYYDEIGNETSSHSCILRHDLDTELWHCGPMAEIEAKLGISATYFVMLRSTSYNLFCLESLRAIEGLIESGHHIGMHLMGEFYQSDDTKVIAEKALAAVDTFQRELGIKIRVVSFHQPGETILNNDIYIDSLINTYNTAQMGDYLYVSDTNMHWRYEHPTEIFLNQLYPRVQLLCHPMWWTNEYVPVGGKWFQVLQSNRNVVVEHWLKRERTLKEGF